MDSRLVEGNVNGNYHRDKQNVITSRILTLMEEIVCRNGGDYSQKG